MIIRRVLATILVAAAFVLPCCAGRCAENSAEQFEREEIDVQLKEQIKSEDWKEVYKNAELGLQYFPDDEAYLKIKADALWNMNDFENAIAIYKHFVEIYPTPRYLANFEEVKIYKKAYEESRYIVEIVDSNQWDMKDVIPLYLNTIYMTQRVDKVHEFVRRFGLQDMAIVHSMEEDLFLLEKDNLSTEERHEAAEHFDNDTIHVRLEEANVLQAQGKTLEADELYKEIMEEDENNIDARMGMGYTKLNERKYEEGRKLFREIFKDHPDYWDAKMGIANSYAAYADYILALSELEDVPETIKLEYLKGVIYTEAYMFDSALDAIKNDHSTRANELRHKIVLRSCPRLILRTSFLKQTLDNRFNLNANKVGFDYTQELKKNLHATFSYTGIAFFSGNIQTGPTVITHFKNHAHDVLFGVDGRISKHWEVHGVFGGRFFGNTTNDVTGTDDLDTSGAMLLCDSWAKYYVNDRFDVQLGFSRYNLEDSYLAAAGAIIAPEVFAGRISDNRVNLSMNYRFPDFAYAFFRGGLGLRPGVNLPTNQYADALLGIGRVVYNNPENPFINMVGMSITTFNSAFKYNVLNQFGEDSPFGVYYSPPYFNASSINIRAEGYIKRIKLRYGIKAFVAGQKSIGIVENQMIGACAVPYISYAPNEHFTVNAVFHYSNFADVRKYYAMVQLQFRFFRK